MSTTKIKIMAATAPAVLLGVLAAPVATAAATPAAAPAPAGSTALTANPIHGSVAICIPLGSFVFCI